MVDYSPEIVDKICERLANGEPLIKICRDKNMPATQTVFCWIRKYPEVADKYARAREDWCDYESENIIAIADDGSRDTVIDADGNERPDNEWINRSKLRVDARKWALSKMNPKKYGDRASLDVALSGNVTISDDIG